MMVMNFSRSLGMRCSGCHKRGDFASDENDHKKVSRAMWAMQQDINQKYLPAMQIEDDAPPVSCWSSSYRPRRTVGKGRSRRSGPARRVT